jgi:hypothetical protein
MLYIIFTGRCWETHCRYNKVGYISKRWTCKHFFWSDSVYQWVGTCFIYLLALFQACGLPVRCACVRVCVCVREREGERCSSATCCLCSEASLCFSVVSITFEKRSLIIPVVSLSALNHLSLLMACSHVNSYSQFSFIPPQTALLAVF